MENRMKRLMRLVLLTLPVALALAVPTVASASANSQDAAVAAAQSARAGAPHLAASTNYIFNDSSIGIGTIHVQDGSYTHGTYDAILQPGGSTDLDFGWATTAGWYTGPGYCTEQWRSSDEVNFVRQTPDLGSGQHFIGASTSYIVLAYHC
jgi:hypothetical protein